MVKYILISLGALVGSFVGYVLLCMILFVISSLFFDHKKDYSKDNSYYRFIFNSATGMVLFFLNIRTEKIGFEKLPKERFLLVSNHISNWDPIVTWFALRKIEKLSFISKKSNIDIPFFGWVSRRICFLPIDRESARNSLVTVDKAADIISSNEMSMGVYPEGTRHKNGVLGKLHCSVFKIAQKANCPIVVIKTTGTNTFKKHFPKRTVVRLEVVDILTKEEVQLLRTSEIGERMAEKMN